MLALRLPLNYGQELFWHRILGCINIGDFTGLNHNIPRRCEIRPAAIVFLVGAIIIVAKAGYAKANSVFPCRQAVKGKLIFAICIRGVPAPPPIQGIAWLAGLPIEKDIAGFDC